MTDIRATTELVDTLAAINRWYPATADPPRTATSQIRVAYASKTPAPADVISARRRCVDALTSWARLVTEECDLRTNLQPSDVEGLTSFLSLHVAWIVDFDGDHANHELHHIAVELEQIVKQNRPKQVEVGPCPSTNDAEQECGGVLVATVRAADDLLPSAIRCTFDVHHTWTPSEWHALGRRVAPANPDGLKRLVRALTDTDAPRSWGVA